MIPPSAPPPAPPDGEPPDGGPDAEERARIEEREEGALLFHVGLFAGLVPGVSLVTAVAAWLRLGGARSRWARRLVALATLDVVVVLATLVAVLLTIPRLQALDADAAAAGGALAPHPRIGVVVEDAAAPEGGLLVLDVATGSPAADAGIARGDRLLTLDGAQLHDRAELERRVGAGPLAPRALTLARGADERALEVTPITGSFRPVPIDRARCADARAELDAALGSIVGLPLALASLGLLALLAGLFAWGRRRGLPVAENARVVIPFLLVLLGAPLLGGLATTLACPLFLSLDVRLETLDIFASEIVLVTAALALLYANRRLAPFLRDDGPRYGALRAIGQSIAYMLAWMPRALALATPLAALFFAQGSLEDAPVAALVSGAGRTPLDAALTFVAAAILAPIAEESLFRGVLAPHLGRMVDGFTAILLTAAIFGLLHLGGHGPLFIGPMFLGAILGWARLRTGHLAASIALHMMLNGTAMLLALTLGIG